MKNTIKSKTRKKGKIKNPKAPFDGLYLDYASATPILPEVLSKMNKAYKLFANPSSLHRLGIKSNEVLEESRKKVSNILGSSPEEIIFTSGGTESVNLAILGVSNFFKKTKKKANIVISSMEHPAVKESAKKLKANGFGVSVVPTDENGFINLSLLEKVINKDTLLVSIMYANNEVGSVQPIKEIMKIIRKKRLSFDSRFPFFHTDASQAVGMLPIEVIKLGVDMMSLDGAKFYGPKGLGALFLKRGISLEPQVVGGLQEFGKRAGTENLPSIVGFSQALEIAERNRESEVKRLNKLSALLIKEIKRNFPKATLNGLEKDRLSNNVNFCFPGLDAEHAVIALDSLGVFLSSASSCKSLSNIYESVIEDKCSNSSLRFSLGRFTNQKDISFVIKALKIAIVEATGKKVKAS